MARVASVIILGLGLVIAAGGVGDAMPDVLVDQPHRHRLEGLRRRAHLVEHVDAVGVLLDHALQAAHLPLDSLEASDVLGLVHLVSSHEQRIPTGRYGPGMPLTDKQEELGTHQLRRPLRPDGDVPQLHAEAVTSGVEHPGPGRHQHRDHAPAGVTVEVVRAIDHDIATGVYTDMTEHGWATDDWPAIHERVLAADILVLCTPIWLGGKSSVCTQVIERLYGGSSDLNEAGQYAYYGRVGGCLVTGNEDGVKHCAMNILYSLQHLGYIIPPQADAGWIGEAGPGRPTWTRARAGRNDFTNRNTTFMTWNLLHLARMVKERGRGAGARQPAGRLGRGLPLHDFENPEHR